MLTHTKTFQHRFLDKGWIDALSAYPERGFGTARKTGDHAAACGGGMSRCSAGIQYRFPILALDGITSMNTASLPASSAINSRGGSHFGTALLRMA